MNIYSCRFVISQSPDIYLIPTLTNIDNMGFDEEIRAIEDEIRNTKYNKATSQHIGRLKAKLAKMKDEAVMRAMKSAGGGEGYAVKKSGDGLSIK